METAQEKNQAEEMSISSMESSSKANERICLVGEVADDVATVDAANTFNVPIVASQSGLELIADVDWITYFVLDDFDSPNFDVLNKSNQCILGPIALKQMVAKKAALDRNAPPTFNFSMDGVVACFSGIQKRHKLLKLVHLMRSMGASVSKDMNCRVTHLISKRTGSHKHRYAVTFRLLALHPKWVLTAWERRDNLDFQATEEEFYNQFKLKTFQGMKISLFGFSDEEHAHMADVLKKNGGKLTEFYDPGCSYIVLPDLSRYYHTDFPNTSATTTSKHSEPLTHITNNSTSISCISPNTITSDSNNIHFMSDLTTVEEVHDNVIEPIYGGNGEYTNSNGELDNNISGRVILDHKRKINLLNAEDEVPSPSLQKNTTLNMQCLASTPKHLKLLDFSDQAKLTTQSPYSYINSTQLLMETSDANYKMYPNELGKELQRIEETETEIENEIDTENIQMNRTDGIEVKEIPDGGDGGKKCQDIGLDIENKRKRKRDSFDSVSLKSVDSCVLPVSNKKPKLLRTGSINRCLKRSMSFVAEHSPIVNIFKPRRLSATLDSIQHIEATAATEANVENTSKNNSIQSILLNDTMTATTAQNSSSRNLIINKWQNIKRHMLRSNVNKDTHVVSGGKAADKSAEPQTTYSKTEKTSSPMSDAKIKSSSSSSSNQRNSLIQSFETILAAMLTPTGYSIYMAAKQQIAVDEPNDKYIHLRAIKPGQVITIVDEQKVDNKPKPSGKFVNVVKSDWFWYSIQCGYADVDDYRFDDHLNGTDSLSNTDGKELLPLNKRKRKSFCHRLQLEQQQLLSGKRRSPVVDSSLLCASGSFLDSSTNSDKLETSKKLKDISIKEISLSGQSSPKTASLRYHYFVDFYNTETNYVGILDTIFKFFKIPLEVLAESPEPLLNKSEIKSIFGNFLPIHAVHTSILGCLRSIHSEWSENCKIGKIILKHRNDLVKAYPPYVNFFEQMKEALIRCDTQNPRFHAFLKINQTKQECGRQTLQDLMIRPVQRLPSISLLLTDILKHTSPDNPDHSCLEEALTAIKEVMTHINEDKRRTDLHKAIFDIYNDIEGCPPDLLSANRIFISRCEVIELSDCLIGRGGHLILFLFSDRIEVCKKRSRVFSTAKSPNACKTLKHIKLISLNAICYVIDIIDSNKAFSLLCLQETDNLFSFNILDEEIDKCVYLKTLCKQMAENACRTDYEEVLIYRTSEELALDINPSAFSKAIKLAARTRVKVGRALSFSKTPSKLKRAVSTIMASPFGSTNSLTPSTQLSQMRLASCTNIHEVSNEEGNTASQLNSNLPLVPATTTEVISPLSTVTKASTSSIDVCDDECVS